MSTPEAVKKNLAALEEEFSSLKASGKLDDQTIQLFQSLLLLVTTVVMLFVEKKTQKTSVNSSLPSSKSGEDETAKKPTTGAKSKGLKHTHDDCDNTRIEVKHEVIEVTHCDHCGEDLTEVKVLDHQRRTLVDIVFVTEQTNVDAQIKCCPACHTNTRGQFPDHMPGPLQYGSGIIAFVVHLVISQMVALRRTAQLLKVMTGRLISEATLLAWVMRVHESLTEWEQVAIEQLLNMPVIYADETSIRINQKKHWIHSYSCAHLVMKICHPKRGKEAFDAINILPRYGAQRTKDDEDDQDCDAQQQESDPKDADPKDDPRPVVVHDRWATYFMYDNFADALCGAHLIRDMQFLIDAHDHSWPKQMMKLLLKANREVSKSEDKVLTDARFKVVRKQYRTILTDGKKQLPAPLQRTGQRGKVAQTDEQNLHDAFDKYEHEILRFTRNPYVSFTNNIAERSIRMSKVKQKISGTFRSVKFAAAYCRISSYLQSMSMLGYSPLTAIQLALKNEAANILRNNG